MSKAFDRINRQSLLQKLANSGIGGNLLNWFHSYLTNRRQRVVVIGATSDPLPVCFGVPQGSILGPALFLLYVNNLPEVVKSSEVAMFADDTKVFSSIKLQLVRSKVTSREFTTCKFASPVFLGRIVRELMEVFSGFESWQSWKTSACRDDGLAIIKNRSARLAEKYKPYRKPNDDPLYMYTQTL